MQRPWVLIEFYLVIRPKGPLSLQCPVDSIRRDDAVPDDDRCYKFLARTDGDSPLAPTRGGHALGHFGGDLDGCIALLDRALVLNPNLSAACVCAASREFPAANPTMPSSASRVQCV